jgi:hypothetical protein
MAQIRTAIADGSFPELVRVQAARRAAQITPDRPAA